MNMNKNTFRLALASTVSALCLPAFNASAWMDQWAPEFTATAAEVQALSGTSVSNYVRTIAWEGEPLYSPLSWQYSEGYALDLNGDGIDDQVFLIPWVGNGLNADGYDVHFFLSNGAKGWRKTVMAGYGVDKSDFVKVAGKTYFRHSAFFHEFEKSKHNHWVYQVFSFDKEGAMRCGNADFGKLFPAVTIFYENPRFRQIELTEGDLRIIAAGNQPYWIKNHPVTVSTPPGEIAIDKE